MRRLLKITMAADEDGNSFMNILNLPKEVFNKILSYIRYKEVSEIRLVCQAFNRGAQAVLNQGFARVDKYHALVQRQIKGQLPRRESERRNHHLARHVDILSAIETRLSLLGMTYLRYIDMGLCCFIPGKVLDELYDILRTLQCTCQLPRAHEFLQELRDISSMAMEHFEEKIVPSLKQKMPSVRLTLGNFNVNTEPEAGSSNVMVPLNNSSSGLRSTSLREDITNINSLVRSQGNSIKAFKRELFEMKNKFTLQRKRIRQLLHKLMVQKTRNKSQNKCISDLNTRLLEEERKVAELSSKLLSQGKTMTELNVRVNDQGRKIAELNQKIHLYENKLVKLSNYEDFKCNETEDPDDNTADVEPLPGPSLELLSEKKCISNTKRTFKRKISLSGNQIEASPLKMNKQ